MRNLALTNSVSSKWKADSGMKRPPQMSADDEKLRRMMACYADGDSGAFSDLFSVLYPSIYRFHLRTMGRPEVAEDLAQKTFLKLHIARRRFRRDAAVKPWVFAIAKNIQRDYFRKRQRSREQLMEDENTTFARNVENDKEEPRDILLEKKLQSALRSIPPNQREVIVLHKFEGLSMQEVATSLGIGVSAAKVRAHRGYRTLRSFLDQPGGAPSCSV